MIRALLTLAVLILPIVAIAADNAPVTYSPEGCEFTITFPEEPYKIKRCDEDGKKCYDMVSYTKVYEMLSTVNFRVVCNPSSENLYKQYSDEVMKATLKAMTKRSIVKTFSSSARTEEKYKQAGLVGEGKTGLIPTIYIAQLWVGHGSIFSVEAELIGEAFEAADELFSQILKSVQFVNENTEEDGEENDKEPTTAAAVNEPR